ncbi:aminotransferase class I/II-fold pyridoxal phosphate-dependent enzyme [Alkaliphilus transvaalensis]|uniref:aminotransferase class I/II-fold pyridoxal phosphate-dependent enzyme n=1 Tax=Alkaliphilus transvaalensis TaxID=114628 RepID=UPI000688225F|nr:aminotransferase class I/II-fold pyridoxal phosphate-dependent enzyme [Alkaliphilus transvaalensis]
MEEKLLIDQLISIQKQQLVSFHVPGHKNGNIFKKVPYKNFNEVLINLDTTEIPGTDNLHNAKGVINEAQERASHLLGSKKTFFLVNGSTSGIYSMIMATTKPGDKIVIGRNCHNSVINALMLADCVPVYLFPEIDHENGLALEISAEHVEDVIIRHPDVKAVVLTYPTYHGIACNLKKIAEVVHKYDKILLIDEAHGAHLGLSNQLPLPALQCGADVVVQSTHKTLPAFTQSSMLHVQGNRIDLDKLKFMLRLNQSSSPSYLLLASLDYAMFVYQYYGKQLMGELLENIKYFKKRMSQFEGVSFLRADPYKKDLYTVDPTKLWINLHRLGVSGVELEAELRNNYAIQMELSNLYGALAIGTIGNEKKDFQRLADALEEIVDKKRWTSNHIQYPTYKMAIPKGFLTPREALYKEKQIMHLDDAEGRISGTSIIPYPPGIPILMPGEIINKEIIDYIKIINKAGTEVVGLQGETNLRIEVIK